MNVKKYFKTIYLLLFFILAVIIISAVVVIYKIISVSPKILAETDAFEYKTGGLLKVKIKNNLASTICFSSCYPYYIERQESGVWKSYNYTSCQKENITDNCCNYKNTKAFEIELPELENGLYRLSIPVCKECHIGDKFREDMYFYSNSFTIKK